jgi:hypothetical protein
MNWTMPYPWRSRRDSVRRINMSSEPGNESFFCALRPIPRILSLRRRDYASQVRLANLSKSSRKTAAVSNAPRREIASSFAVSGRASAAVALRAARRFPGAHARRMRIAMARVAAERGDIFISAALLVTPLAASDLNFFHNVPGHIRQTKLPSLEQICEFLVVDAQQI